LDFRFLEQMFLLDWMLLVHSILLVIALLVQPIHQDSLLLAHSFLRGVLSLVHSILLVQPLLVQLIHQDLLLPEQLFHQVTMLQV
jgi:hypothetical protein